MAEATGRQLSAPDTGIAKGILMLVTDTSWAESHPVRQALAEPYQAWHCVGWTDELLNFLIVASGSMRDREHLPDGWLVGGPDALLDTASQLPAGAFSVYALDRAAEAAKINFSQITGIWRERKPVVSTYWYRTMAGTFEPCSGPRGRRTAPPELVCALDLGEAVVSSQADQ
jgi:hypothetical protein